MTESGPAEAPGDASWGRRALRRATQLLSTGDGKAIAVLLVIPVVLYSVPALAGYPSIAGDNLLQNFPLRVLSGQIMRAGHLPLWNPLIWSGSPLLGGLNAGSFYPFTFLFVFLPALVAWVVNLVLVYWAAMLGMYALVRQFRIGALAAFLAALTYGLTGTMSGQLVHLGIVQGMGWMPLLVLAMLRLSWALFGRRPVPPTPDQVPAPVRTPWSDPAPGGTPSGTLGGTTMGAPSQDPGPIPSPGELAVGERSSPWPWTVLLAAVVGVILLTGEPRSMDEAEIVGGVTGLWLVVRPYGRGGPGWRERGLFAGHVLLAVTWAAALSAAELLPGLSFITASQRATESYAFFGSGSLYPSWSVLLLVPDLFGGDGILHQPAYFNSYNMPEVTGYVGLLPLVAFFVLLVRAVGRRRDPRSHDFGLFVLLAALGTLLAFGSYTWFGHLFWKIPFFGLERLQSRNIGITDLALAVLLGFFVDGLLRAPARRGWRARRSRAGPGLARSTLDDGPASCTSAGGLPGRLVSPGDQGRGWLVWGAALVPLVAAGALCVTALAVPSALEVAFRAGPIGAALGPKMRPWFVAQLVVVAAVSAVVLLAPRRAPGGRRRLVVGAVVLDVVLFMVSSSNGLLPGHVQVEPSRASAAAVLGTSGRFAIYDPGFIPMGILSTIGETDLNVFTGLPSAQGYGSIVSHPYDDATGSHLLGTMDPCALARGVFTPLRLGTLLVAPSWLTHVLGPSAPPLAIPACPGALPAGSATRRNLYFGGILHVVSVDLVPSARAGAPRGVLPGSLQVGVVTPSGATVWPAVQVSGPPGGPWQAVFATPQLAAGITVGGTARAVGASSVVTTQAGARVSFARVLQVGLDQSVWRYAGLWNGFSIFHASQLVAPIAIAHPAPGATVRQLRVTSWGTEVDQVNAPRSTLVVRSEAYMAGWRATAVEEGTGRTVDLTVEKRGLVQAVQVPPGRWTVTFWFHPGGLDPGLALSGVALAGFAASGLVAWRRRRRATGARSER